MIELRALGKSYGRVRAVHDISLSTKEGEIFGVLGPNGAGKSSTIKMAVGILEPDAGSILFDGQPMREADKDRIGYLPEERGLYKNVKIGEMLLYLASLKGLDRPTAIERLDFWLDRFGLAAWRDSPPEALSKGMGQKAQFIAAVLHDPEFLFLDEPFSGLDPLATDELREAILELAARGRTILFSTHNMEAAERICSRILVIDRGREVLSGSLAEIKSRYGRNAVAVEFDGDLDFAPLSGMLREISRFPRWVELELADGASSDALLRLIAAQVSVRRFEVIAPSLHDIFVGLIGGRNA